jgi:hypothetical protein
VRSQKARIISVVPRKKRLEDLFVEAVSATPFTQRAAPAKTGETK